MERAVARHREHLSAAVTAQPQPTAENRPEVPPAPGAPRSDRVAVRTRARHANVHRLLAAGLSYPKIAAELGITRNTVRRFARAAHPDELLVNDGTGRRPRVPDDYEPCLRERWNSGCTNAAQLHQELRDRGYLARFRGNGPAPPPAAAPPKTRAVTNWIMTRPGTLDAGDQASLGAILAASPELAATAARVREFAGSRPNAAARTSSSGWPPPRPPASPH